MEGWTGECLWDIIPEKKNLFLNISIFGAFYLDLVCVAGKLDVSREQDLINLSIYLSTWQHDLVGVVGNVDSRLNRFLLALSGLDSKNIKNHKNKEKEKKLQHLVSLYQNYVSTVPSKKSASRFQCCTLLPKKCEIIMVPSNHLNYQYWDSNIELFSIAPCKVFTLNPLCIFFGISSFLMALFLKLSLFQLLQ